MKAELTFPPELVDEIVDRVCERLAHLVASGKGADDDPVFDVEGLAQYLRVGNQWVYEKVHRNAIPHFKMGKYPRFRKSDIDQWLKTMERGKVRKPAKTVRRLLEDGL